MGNAALVPFGLLIASGKFVDVGSVPRGMSCGCVCPSCETPLIAKQGAEKEWHFAHATNNVHQATRNDCDYSFAVSVRLMIRQLSEDGLLFRVPRLERSVELFSEYSHKTKSTSYLVTDESILDICNVTIGARFSSVLVDVLGYVKGAPFIVYITHKDRPSPVELDSPDDKTCGVVKVDVDLLRGLFKNERQGRYMALLRRHIEEHTDGKTWVYHPREEMMRSAGLAKLKKRLEEEGSTKIPHKRDFKCVVCGKVWTGISPVCKNCNTHLYTTEHL